MAVRNFWVDASVDGRKTDVGTGPRAKNGGMEVTLYQREDGCISTALRIACRVNWQGQLVTTARNANGEVVFEFVTER
jgi:hypothetical protein